jgi:hypothetical protein
MNTLCGPGGSSGVFHIPPPVPVFDCGLPCFLEDLRPLLVANGETGVKSR